MAKAPWQRCSVEMIVAAEYRYDYENVDKRSDTGAEISSCSKS